MGSLRMSHNAETWVFEQYPETKVGAHCQEANGLFTHLLDLSYPNSGFPDLDVVGNWSWISSSSVGHVEYNL